MLWRGRSEREVKVKPGVEPVVEPGRRLNPGRVCPDQVQRIAEPLRKILP